MRSDQEALEKARARLKTALSSLYRIFSKYDSTSPVEGCHCCTNPEHWQLLAGDVRKIPTAILAEYAFCALLTWGSLTDFKRFLPRIFELLAFEPQGFMEIDLVIKRLYYGKWREWPAPEQESVETYLKALTEFAMASGPDYPELSAVIEGSIIVGFNIAEALIESYAADDSLNKTLSICALIDDWSYSIDLRKMKRDKAYSPVLSWLQSEAVCKRLEEAFFANMKNEEVSAKISAAVDAVVTLS